MKVLTVVGARPQFIKAGPVSAALAQHGIEEVMVHTGQHYDHLMSQVFFDELGLRPPARNLNVGSGSHAAQTAAMLTALEDSMLADKPDWVLIYGDTNSTLAGALAAAKLHIPIAHVEAGLRSFNRQMPEEINRIVADALADLLFSPTATGVRNLRNEGIPERKIVLTGDVMYDAARMYGAASVATRSAVLSSHAVTSGNYVLATVHRAENTDHPQRLTAIATGLGNVSAELPVLWAIHPRTRKMLATLNVALPAGLRIVEPVGYLDMVQLERNAVVIATDSGGVQKEAFFYGVPCVTLREETEWTELVTLDWNAICPPLDPGAIAATILSRRNHPGLPGEPFGRGDASEKIAAALGNH